MTVRELNSRQLAVGLSWLPPGEIASGRGEKRRARELLKIRPQPACYAELELPWATQVAVTSDSATVGHISAAAWLAAAQKSAVLVEQLGDGEYWLCTVEDGVVFPAGDIVGNRDRISARIAELQNDLAGHKISCYDKLDQFKLPDVQPLDFSDLTSGTDPTDGWIVKKIRRERSRTPLVSLAVAAVCIAAGYGTWHWYSSSPEAPVVDSSAEYARQQQFELEKSVLSQTLSQDAGQLVALLAREIAARPHRAAGWRNISARWMDDRMETEWHRAHGSYSSLSTYLAAGEFRLDETNGSVTERYPFAAPAGSHVDIDQILTTSPDRYALLDTLAGLPGKWTISPAQLTGSGYPVKKSALTGEVTGFAEARAAARFFSAWPISLSSVSIQLSPRPTWQFAGDLYATSN